MTPLKLYAERKTLGWSQRRMAEELGLTLAGYQKIENGSINPKRIDKRTELAVRYLVLRRG